MAKEAHEVLWQKRRLDGGQQLSEWLGEEPGKEPEPFDTKMC